jgi:hypothetical protein
VEGILRDRDDPFVAVEALIRDGGFAEIIISTSRDGRRDGFIVTCLPRRVDGLGVPVTVVEMPHRRAVSREDATVSLLGGVPTAHPDRR